MLDDLDRDELQQLISRSKLVGVTTDELSARRSETVPGPDDDSKSGMQLEVTVQTRNGNGTFSVRLIADLTTDLGNVSAKVAAHYEITEGAAPDPRGIAIFANEVAVMMLVPYLREAIANATDRVLGEAVHLPILERGVIGSEVPERQ